MGFWGPRNNTYFSPETKTDSFRDYYPTVTLEDIENGLQLRDFPLHFQDGKQQMRMETRMSGKVLGADRNSLLGRHSGQERQRLVYQIC